ncbi:MAG: hypothetical protein WAQ24_01445 [Candidatus Saccharimonadales bacterium]
MIRLPSVPCGAQAPETMPEITVESLEGKFSPLGFQTLTGIVNDYKNSINATAGISPERGDSTGSTSIAESPFSTCGKEWRKECATLHAEAEGLLPNLEENARKIISDEFAACGVPLPPPGQTVPEERQAAVSMFETAIKDLQGQTRGISAELKNMQNRYLWLVGSFLGDPLVPEDIATRMKEALGAQLAKLTLHDPAIAQPPKWQFFKRAEYNEQAVEQAALIQKRLGRSLPMADAVIKDYFNSVRGAHMRAVYGYRQLILDKGFESDDTSQIDSFQRTHYDDFGENYLIAVTPVEWTERVFQSWLNNLLYSDESSLSVFLDTMVKNDTWADRARMARSRRDHMKKSTAESRASTDIPLAAPETSDASHAQGSETGSAQTIFEDERQDVFNDITLLINARLPRNIEATTQSRLYEVCKQLLKTKPSSSKKYQIGDTDSRIRMLSRLIAATHPDKTSDGDLCRIFTNMQKSIQLEENPQDKAV